MAQQRTQLQFFFFFISCVPSGFFLVKQCSSCFPSLAIGQGVTEVPNLNTTLVLHYVTSSVVLMCAEPHFVKPTSLHHHSSRPAVQVADCSSPFSSPGSHFSMSQVMLCKYTTLGIMFSSPTLTHFYIWVINKFYLHCIIFAFYSAGIGLICFHVFLLPSRQPLVSIHFHAI